MALKNVVGIDHAVVMVKDLDKAAENWKRLGFTVSPRGTHSAHMGSGNYTIMLDPDYMELLGVLTPTEHNAPARAFLEKRGEGIERIAFTAVDSTAGAEEIRARGYVADRTHRFRAAGDDARRHAFGGQIPHLPVADRGSTGRRAHLRLPAQDARDGVDSRTDAARQWRQAPAAGADRLAGAGQGRGALSKMIDRDGSTEADGAIAVPSGADRADFVFLTRDQLGKRYPEVSLAGVPERGGAGLVIAADLAATEKALGCDRRPQRRRHRRAAAAGNGTLLAFVKA